MHELSCGAARIRITPPGELLRRLRGLAGHELAGVIDDLYVRVLAIDDGVRRALILSFDLVSPPEPEKNLRALAEHTGVAEENILFFSIHTHAAPITWIQGPPEEAPEDLRLATETYCAFLRERILRAADTAVQSMRPARLGWTYGQSFINVVRNQNYAVLGANGEARTVLGLGADYGAPVDRTVFALRAEEPDGKPIAFLLNYPMHNVVTIWNDFDGQDRMGVSGDVGGNVCRYMEKEYDGAICLWSSGAAGDINPIMLNETIYPDPETGLPREVAVRGSETARIMLQVMAGRHYADVHRVVRGITCDVRQAPIACTTAWSYTPGCACVSGEAPLFETGGHVPRHSVRLHLIRLGQLALYGVTGELYSSFTQVIRAASPLKDTVVITHDASDLANCHYIIDDDTLARAEASGGDLLLPGYREFRNLPGYMEASLAQLTGQMFKALESGELPG